MEHREPQHHSGKEIEQMSVAELVNLVAEMRGRVKQMKEELDTLQDQVREHGRRPSAPDEPLPEEEEEEE